MCMVTVTSEILVHVYDYNSYKKLLLGVTDMLSLIDQLLLTIGNARNTLSKSTINQSINFYTGLSSDATARTTMGVTVKKCHIIMSGNDC